MHTMSPIKDSLTNASNVSYHRFTDSTLTRQAPLGNPNRPHFFHLWDVLISEGDVGLSGYSTSPVIYQGY